MDINITLPEGASNHGNPNLLCLPPNWYDYIIFYLTNYFAHALTVLATPGQAPWEAFIVRLAALLFPGSGVAIAARAILRGANLRRHPLRRAARAGALCMLIKTPGEHDDPEAVQATPREYDGPIFVAIQAQPEIRESSVKVPSPDNVQTLQGCWWKYNDILVHPAARVHGERRIPKGYQLVLVPPYVPLEFGDDPDEGDNTGPIQRELACSYNVPKLLVSLAQAVWASITIYRARGDQIDQYGYAAFGLTVIPYAFMSVVNITAGLLTPEYSAVFMVRTPIMDEAERAGDAFFKGEIRIKSPEADSSFTYRGIMEDGKQEDALFEGVVVVMGLVPLAIFGVLSRFQTGDSTSVQRGFTISWLVLGIVMGISFLTATEGSNRRILYLGGSQRSVILFLTLFYLVWGVCAIGGMVVVGLMIRDYGICTRVD